MTGVFMLVLSFTTRPLADISKEGHLSERIWRKKRQLWNVENGLEKIHTDPTDFHVNTNLQ